MSYRTVKAQLAVNEGVNYKAEPAITPLVFDIAFTFRIFKYGPLPIRKFQAQGSSVLPNSDSLKRVVHAEIPAF